MVFKGRVYIVCVIVSSLTRHYCRGTISPSWSFWSNTWFYYYNRGILYFILESQE